MKFFVIAGFLLMLPCSIFAQALGGAWGIFSSEGFTPRGAFTTCEVGGKIYVIGGFDGTNYITTVEVFDPATNTWDSLATKGTFTPRRGVCSVVIGGNIYVFGGANDSAALNTLEVLNPASGVWSTPMTSGTFSPRWRSSAVLMGSKVYIIGGYNSNSATGELNTFEAYDTLTHIWTTPATTGTFSARSDFAAEAIDGKIYVVGGQGDSALPSPQVFDTATSVWSTPMTAGTYSQRQGLAAALIGETIYAFEGKDLETGNYLNTIDVYDPQSNAWSNPSATGIPIARAGSCATLCNGNVYIVGGRDAYALLDTNEVFTPVTNAVRPSPASERISCFPNPTDGNLMIQGDFDDFSRLTITNILGQVLFDKAVDAGSQAITFDLSSLTSGVYCVHMGPSALFEQAIIKR